MLRYVISTVVSFLFLAPALGDDQWEFLPGEQERCKSLELTERLLPFTITVPKDAYFRNDSIMCGTTKWLRLSGHAIINIDGIRNTYDEQGYAPVVTEPNLLIYHKAPEGYSMHYLHQERGKQCSAFISQIKSRDEIFFRAKCARSLRLTSSVPPSERTTEANYPGIGYPRIDRVWSDANRKFQTQAKLLWVAKNTALLRKDDRTEIAVPLEKLDGHSRSIAIDAMPYFVIEQMMQKLIGQQKKHQPASVAPEQIEADWKALLARVNQYISGQKLSLRYRIIRMSGKMPPRQTDSPTGEYLLTLKPLYEFQTMETSKGPIALHGFSLNTYSIKAEDFNPLRFDAGQSVIEFTGTPVFRTGDGLHFRPTGLRSGTESLGLALNEATVRVFKPGIVNYGLDSLFFTPPQVAASSSGTPRATDPREQKANEWAEKMAKQREGKGTGRVGKNQHGYAITGSRYKHAIDCEGENVSITGTLNTITIRGKCNILRITGSGQLITVEEVSIITISGGHNEVQFVRGSGGKHPQIQDSTKQNDVTQIDSMPTE